jgi:mannose-6-phosphate isomerase-like protein (cupin superfamily)
MLILLRLRRGLEDLLKEFAGISSKLLFSIGVFNPGEGLNPHIYPESDEVYYVLEGRELFM